MPPNRNIATDPKYHSKEVTIRFIQEIDRLIGRSISQAQIGEAVGIKSSNITRLRKLGNNCVTIDSCCRLIETYGTDPGWLFMGEERLNKSLNISHKNENLEGMIKVLDKKITKLLSQKRAHSTT